MTPTTSVFPSRFEGAVESFQIDVHKTINPQSPRPRGGSLQEHPRTPELELPEGRQRSRTENRIQDVVDFRPQQTEDETSFADIEMPRHFHATFGRHDQDGCWVADNTVEMQYRMRRWTKESRHTFYCILFATILHPIGFSTLIWEYHTCKQFAAKHTGVVDCLETWTWIGVGALSMGFAVHVVLAFCVHKFKDWVSSILLYSVQRNFFYQCVWVTYLAAATNFTMYIYMKRQLWIMSYEVAKHERSWASYAVQNWVLAMVWLAGGTFLCSLTGLRFYPAAIGFGVHVIMMTVVHRVAGDWQNGSLLSLIPLVITMLGIYGVLLKMIRDTEMTKREDYLLSGAGKLLFRRYHVPAAPSYCSSTSTVWEARDIFATRKSSQNNRQALALKVMKNEKQFKSEVKCRQVLKRKGNEFEEAVVKVLRMHVPKKHQVTFKAEFGELVAEEATEDDNEYAIVMPLADRNLGEIVLNEQFAGRNPGLIKQYMQHIMRCLEKLHNAGLCHGDLKPANILRDALTKELKLADMDAAEAFGNHIGHKAVTSSAFIPPEDAKRLTYNEDARIEATVAYDMWMLGTVLFFMLTGKKLFPTATEDSDTIEPTAMEDLIGWKGLKERQTGMILHSCNDLPTLKVYHLRHNGTVLLEKLLAQNPAERPKSVREVLDYEFMKESLDSLVIDATASQGETIGFALVALSRHMQFFCDGLVDKFNAKCEDERAKTAITKKEAIDKFSRRKPMWQNINGNSKKKKQIIFFNPPLQIGEKVEVWMGKAKTKNWSDGDKISEATILRSFPPGTNSLQCLHELLVVGQKKSVTKKEEHIRRKSQLHHNTEAQMHTNPDDDKVAIEKVPRLVEVLEAECIFTQQEINQVCAVLCPSNNKHQETTVAPDELSTDHFDCTLKDCKWDLVRLFVSPMNINKFIPEWRKQDATNLLNLIASIADSGLAEDALDVKKLRNLWAHQQEMEAEDFQVAMKTILGFRKRMKLRSKAYTPSDQNDHKDLMNWWEQIEMHVRDLSLRESSSHQSPPQSPGHSPTDISYSRTLVDLYI